MGEIIRERDELLRRAVQPGAAVVLADGAFDVIHPGHVRFLEEASLAA